MMPVAAPQNASLATVLPEVCEPEGLLPKDYIRLPQATLEYAFSVVEHAELPVVLKFDSIRLLQRFLRVTFVKYDRPRDLSEYEITGKKPL